MIEAWATDDVRAAEAALMAELPDGELMARAAEGLAQVALARLTERGGSAVVALVGPGNNGDRVLVQQTVSQTVSVSLNCSR